MFITLFILSISFVFSQGTKKQAKILKNPGIGKIIKMDVLNSKYQETNLSISPDGKYLFFMSENPSSWSTANYAGEKGRYDGDIWYSQNINGNWQKPKNVGRTINTPQGEDEPNISPDGQTVCFQSWRTDWKTTGGPYYKAELSGTKWKNPVGLNSGITEFFKNMEKTGQNQGTDGATFSSDGKKFIIAYGAGYRSNMDIYMSTKDSKGKWSTFKKLPISTPNNERSPFLAADGKTLYFASDGYTGFGKLDIYKTTLNDDGTCGEVVNIGEPFNTKEDDYGFVLTASGDDAYFVRNGDIYYVDLRKTTQDIKPIPTVILSGIVRDSISGKPLEALVKVKDMSNNTEVGTSRSNANTGEYSVVLNRGKKYLQLVDRAQYKEYSKSIGVPSDTNFTEIKRNVDLVPISFEPQVVPVDTIKPIVKDTIKPVVKDTIKPINEIKKDTIKKEVIKPPILPTKTEPEKNCLTKLLDNTHLSFGLAGAYPPAFGLKAELDYKNFGFTLSGLYLPNVGELDETKPPEKFKSDNYSKTFLAAIIYHFPLNCQFYPFVGLYYGLQQRHWKKDIVSQGGIYPQEGDYTAYHYGIALGTKIFFGNSFYIEPSLGLGKNSVHSQPSGDIIRWDYQAMLWLSGCFIFEL
jgi:hypothetical protein